MSLILAHKLRGLTRHISIVKADGTTIITPGENDKIRIIIGREGKLGNANADAKLVVTSDAPTENGSSFTKNQNASGTETSGTNTLRLDASDLDFEPGVYTLFVDYYDNADAQEWKLASKQVFCLRDF